MTKDEHRQRLAELFDDWHKQMLATGWKLTYLDGRITWLHIASETKVTMEEATKWFLMAGATPPEF